MDGDANSDADNYLFAADGATRRRPQVINPRLFLPGRPRGEVPVTAGHQFVRAAGAGAISLKSFFQKDFKETAMWRIIYIADAPPPLPPYNVVSPPPARGRAWRPGGRGRPQGRRIYILYVQAVKNLPPRAPMKFIGESLGARKPMERGNSKLTGRPCVFRTPR